MHSYFGGPMPWLIILIIAGLVVFLLVHFIRKNHSSITTETPLDILKKRFARGEISKDDFDKMKSVL